MFWFTSTPNNNNNRHLTNYEINAVVEAFLLDSEPNLAPPQYEHVETCWQCKLKVGQLYDQCVNEHLQVPPTLASMAPKNVSNYNMALA